MLIKCPECDLQISDKAVACPHCGYPLKPSEKSRKKYNRGHLRLPNGFGRITEIKNRNLRNPFRVLVTAGKDANGRPIAKPLQPKAYFKTYNEAYSALVEYHKDPVSLEPQIKMTDLFQKWSSEYFLTLKAKSSVRTITAVWAYCSPIYNLRVTDVRARHLKTCIMDAFIVVKGEKKYASAGIKSRMKSLFNLMMDYAVEYELVDRNYARAFVLPSEISAQRDVAKIGHKSYSETEMELLWKYQQHPIAAATLIQCYSGWRPQELVQLRLDDVNLKNWTFTGGMKTTAGMNRIVPIHTSIRKLVARFYREAQEAGRQLLVLRQNKKGGVMEYTYSTFRGEFEQFKTEIDLGADHRPHDGRKQFITMAKASGVDEYAIKRIVGHQISDITEKIYTDRTIDWLQKEIEKIKGPSK